MTDIKRDAGRPSLTLTRHIKAPVERVFKAWIEGEALRRWFGPRDSVSVSVADVDLRIGGRYRIVMQEPGGETHRVSGEYREIVPNERLVFTWAWESTPERQSLVTVVLRPVQGGTDLTLTHAQFFDEAARDRHAAGWGGSLPRLANFLLPEAAVAQGRHAGHKVVSGDEWIAARKALLAREKAFTRQRDQLSAERRALPWVRVDKPYLFDGPRGRETLAELFEGKSQLLVYHFMFGPDWSEGCPSCSFWADNFNGAVTHLKHRDVTLIAISRAPLDKLDAYKKRLGWSFKWVSSLGNDFNRDFNVSFTPEEKATAYYNFEPRGFPATEAPGISAFHMDEARKIFHTYSCYARGLDMVNGAYQLLDLVPNGRDEEGSAHPMSWVRRRDQYVD